MASSEASSECPICQTGKLTILHAVEDVPGFGRIVLLTFKCNSCGYRAVDILPVEEREPAAYIAHISSPEDLKIKVLRASTGFVEIPELGVEIKPGPAAQGFITNVEGLLARVEEAASALQGDPEAEGRLKAFLEKLREAMEGRLAFTVIIRDPSGASGLSSEQPGKVERKPLTREEAERLRSMLVGLAFELR